MELQLVLGGIRSGKTQRAHALARRHAGEIVHIATSRNDGRDPEWAARIARHRRTRPRAWLSVEAPFALARAVRFFARADRLLLVDCISVWLANLLLDGQNWERALAELLAVVAHAPGRAVFVSNEVGWSLVPTDPLGRAFCDALGVVNQRLAACAARVELVVAGHVIPIAEGDGDADGD